MTPPLALYHRYSHFYTNADCMSAVIVGNPDTLAAGWQFPKPVVRVAGMEDSSQLV